VLAVAVLMIGQDPGGLLHEGRCLLQGRKQRGCRR